VSRVRRATSLKKQVNVLVTASHEMRALNRRFRGKNRPTDVLSFPATPGIDNFAGDVAISGEIAAHNAADLGHAPADEVKILVLHGVLHLAGYDHENDNGEMAQKEMRLRKVLGLPTGLIERGANRIVEKSVAPRPPRGRGC
jgi:probable rRNA maturation factor